MLKRKNPEKFADELNTAVLNTLRAALEGIQKMEYTKPNGATGKTEYDYELTARMMKIQAKLALELISNLQNE